MVPCCTYILQKFSEHQVNIFGKFTRRIASNQTENLSKFSLGLNENYLDIQSALTLLKTKHQEGIARISETPSSFS